MSKISKNANCVFRTLSEGETLIIPACDGSNTIAKEIGKTFDNTDPQFKTSTLNFPSHSTTATRVKILDVTWIKFSMENTREYMYKHLVSDLKNLVFTQHQIIAFVKTFPNWLCLNGKPNLFFSVQGNTIFITCIHIHPTCTHPHASYMQINNESIWGQIITPDPDSHFIDTLPI